MIKKRQPGSGITPRTRTSLALGMAVLFLSGCDTNSEPAPEVQAEGAQEDRFPPAVSPATSINAIMVGLVDHAAHYIWDAGAEETAPETDEDWEEVEYHAIQLVAAGTLITAGGTGVFDDEWVRQGMWQEFASNVTDAGLEAQKAASRQDLEGVLEAGNSLIEVCEGCHAAYKPALPTEGIFHDQH